MTGPEDQVTAAKPEPDDSVEGLQIARKSNDKVVIALVLAGLVIIMTGLVLLPALILGYGSGLEQSRIQALALETVSPSAPWQPMDEVPGFAAAWRSESACVFFFDLPCGSGRVDVALIVGDGDTRLLALDVPELPDVYGLDALLSRYRALLGKDGSAVLAASDPVNRADGASFLELVARAVKASGKKGTKK